MKIIVVLQEDTAGVGSITTQSEEAGPSAFEVMRQAMREQARVRTPSLTQERNKKNKLYNVVVENLKQVVSTLFLYFILRIYNYAHCIVAIGFL